MVEQNHNNQTKGSASESTGSVIRGSGDAAQRTPSDLEPAEKSTWDLLDSLPAVLPADDVDNLILQQAALAVESPVADKSTTADGHASNVVPLYNHEREVSFRQVFPKVFVAAAVVVLAVVVVPLVDRMGFTDMTTTSSMQTASSDNISQNTDRNAEQLEASSLMTSDDTDALVESVSEDEASSESLSVQADLPVAQKIENPFTRELAIAADGDVAKAREIEPSEESAIKKISEAKSAASDAEESVVAGVTRTTIISTETSATPSVVQNINITSAARVQRRVEVGGVESAEDAHGDVAIVESVAPAYRGSLHRWKAEILKLARLGEQQQAQIEYALYIKEHPQHAFVFEQSAQKPEQAAPSAVSIPVPIAVPADENIEASPIIILPAESKPPPEKQEYSK